MSDLTPSEETAYGLINLLGNKDFKDKLDQLVGARRDSEAAAKAASDEIDRLGRERKKHEAETARIKDSLIVRQAEHDKAAAEAAARIDVQQKQLAEVLRIKGENDKKDADLKRREADHANALRNFATEKDAVRKTGEANRSLQARLQSGVQELQALIAKIIG